ncbi:MAG: AAA family ATPase [Fimbriiglobus sp.]
MKGFERIHIQGFRRLRDVDLKLNPLNVLIGPNGCGKTSLLDVFSLLAASASGRLKSAMSDLGGITSNLTSLSGDQPAGMKFEITLPLLEHKQIEYSLALTSRGVSFEIEGEILFQNQTQVQSVKYITSVLGKVEYYDTQLQKKLGQLGWEFNTSESALSQAPKMLREPETFRQSLQSLTYYQVLSVSRRAPVRLPQQLRDAKLPGQDGEDLASCLYMVRETDPDTFEAIEATLRAGFPDFERLNFPAVAAGLLAMTWKDKSSKHPFYMHQLSEGTLRFLWLVTLLHSPGLTEVTMIDEPEVSLHPELLMVLADLFRDASRRTQLFVATHSDRLIRFLKPADILAISLDEHGAAQFTRADELELDSWLEEYTLDQLWQNGRLGARP